jgi:3'(2'), 5'-bisphosphate nucleotidase
MINNHLIKEISALLTVASAAIMEIYESGSFSVSQKDDHSPLTRADLASNAIINKGLQRITPDIPVISEETLHLPYKERRHFKEVWILDPIDGTREFVNRNGEFCISLALIKDGSPVAGFIMAPVTGELWYALEGQGAWYVTEGNAIRLPLTGSDTGDGDGDASSTSICTGSGSGNDTISVTNPGICYDTEIRRKIIITRSRSHHNDKEKEWIDRIIDIFGAVTVIQGSALKFCRLAEGSTSVYPKFGPINEWDVAAGDIILRESGGEIVEVTGGVMPIYNKPDLKQPHFIAYARGIRKLLGE